MSSPGNAAVGVPRNVDESASDLLTASHSGGGLFVRGSLLGSGQGPTNESGNDGQVESERDIR